MSQGDKNPYIRTSGFNALNQHSEQRSPAVDIQPLATPIVGLSTEYDNGTMTGANLKGLGDGLSSILSWINGAQYGMPVWGSCLQSSDALNNGDYLNAACFLGLGFFEAFTFGEGTEVRLGMNATKTGAEKAIVIGEGMSRVKPAAQSVGAKWYQAWSKNFPKNGELMTPEELDAALQRNSRWLNSKINQGYKIYDIGIDATRITRSPFYELEKGILEQTGYQYFKLY